MSPWQPHLQQQTSRKPTYPTFSVARRYLILHCLGLTCLPHLSTKPNWVAVNILRAINPRGTRRMKRESALLIKIGFFYPFTRSSHASLFKHCPYMFIGAWVQPDSEAGFSIGVYHTSQLPMLDVKNKGGIPSIEAGTNEWIKTVRSKNAHSKSGCWTQCAVSGLLSLSRHKAVVRKQCSSWRMNRYCYLLLTAVAFQRLIHLPPFMQTGPKQESGFPTMIRDSI